MKRALLGAACFAAVLAAAPEAPVAQGGRTIDDVPGRPAGRVSETAPAPPANSGAERFRADLASCNARPVDARADCRREMHAARAQGLYRN